mmetsp:Transcript_32341/g.93162  ORF Transcript_32341/g.93162 Transcript_32341/m.93162 type:complete len:263 (-) Transcript_32341:746-1534(-)
MYGRLSDRTSNVPRGTRALRISLSMSPVSKWGASCRPPLAAAAPSAASPAADGPLAALPGRSPPRRAGGSGKLTNTCDKVRGSRRRMASSASPDMRQRFPRPRSRARASVWKTRSRRSSTQSQFAFPTSAAACAQTHSPSPEQSSAFSGRTVLSEAVPALPANTLPGRNWPAGSTMDSRRLESASRAAFFSAAPPHCFRSGPKPKERRSSPTNAFELGSMPPTGSTRTCPRSFSMGCGPGAAGVEAEADWPSACAFSRKGRK